MNRLTMVLLRSISVIGFSTVAAGAHALSAIYTLENVVLADGTQMTGTFSWTWQPGDFENGVGHFTALDIPHTWHDHTDLETTINIGESIEIVLDGSVHDDGVDITLVLVQPLTPTTSSPIDLGLSKYEIGGNGFHDGLFLSGTVAPIGDNDNDGITDDVDNCLEHVNPSQSDTNADGIGNACDADINNDCSVNFADLAAFKAAFQPRPYVGDADFNGDGFVNFGDLAVMKATFFNGTDPGPGPSALPNACG